MPVRVGDLPESWWIARLLGRNPADPFPPDGARNASVPGDDAIVLPAGPSPVITVDTLTDGVHFRLSWFGPGADPSVRGAAGLRAVGRKCVAVNLSDLYAMDAVPEALFVALAAPPDMAADDLTAIADGIREASGGCIAGGDTTRAPVLTVSITAVGRAGPAGVTARSAARPGDELWLVGDLGFAAAGLVLLERGPAVWDDDERRCVRAQIDPSPPPGDGIVARVRAVGAPPPAAVDVSDGLWLDVSRLAARSGVSARLWDAALAPDPALARVAARLGLDATALVYGGGEDYARVAAASPDAGAALAAAGYRRIGGLVAGAAGEVVRVNADGRALPPPARAGYDAFGGG